MRAPLFLVEVAAASCGTAPLKPCLKFRDKGTGRAANAGAISLNAGHRHYPYGIDRVFPPAYSSV